MNIAPRYRYVVIYVAQYGCYTREILCTSAVGLSPALTRDIHALMSCTHVELACQVAEVRLMISILQYPFNKECTILPIV